MSSCPVGCCRHGCHCGSLLRPLARRGGGAAAGLHHRQCRRVRRRAVHRLRHGGPALRHHPAGGDRHGFVGPRRRHPAPRHDGGATFGAPQEVLASPAVTPGAVTGTLVAQGYTFCNTVPAGVGIAASGSPHAGRIIVAWIAADLAQNATGCNISMLQSFHTLWVSYSDDNGVTWTPQQAFDAGFGHDASTPFASFTLDNQGNPYYGFANNLNSNPATCSAESTAGTVQSDTSCEYDMYVVWSSDGGKTWDGGGGIIPGSAARAYRVNSTAETGTHWFPAIAAAAPGRVDVAYLRTTEILPTDPFGKADAGGCAGPQAPGNPPTYPPACQWNLYAGQSVNLTSSPASATWTVTQITTTPMHVGDICNLGIFCLAPSSNRNLLDFIMEDLDQKGCAHISYAVFCLKKKNDLRRPLRAGLSRSQCSSAFSASCF